MVQSPPWLGIVLGLRLGIVLGLDQIVLVINVINADLDSLCGEYNI